MKAVLVFLEGALCDSRHREALEEPGRHKREEILKDSVVPGAVRCMQELAERYKLVYIGARPESAVAATEEWLAAKGFPRGAVFLAPTHEERLALAQQLKTQFEFAAGIGERWTDNELHLEIGCMSIIVKEYEGRWDTVRRHLLSKEHNALQEGLALLAPWTLRTETPRPMRYDVWVAPENLVAAATALHQAHWGYLSAISGVDLGAQAGEIEVIYTFCADAALILVRVRTPRGQASVPSLSGVIPSVVIYERELREMLGVEVVGIPTTRRLFLPEDWPDGVYPLRKDYVVPQAPGSE